MRTSKLYFPWSVQSTFEEREATANLLGVYPFQIIQKNTEIAYQTFLDYRENRLDYISGQNSLWILLSLFHDRSHDWIVISANPNITPAILEANPDKPWVEHGLSRNPNMTMRFVQNHPEFKWDYRYLAQYANLSLSDVLNHPKIQFWDSLSSNMNLNIREILSRKDLPWDWRMISLRDDLRLEDLLQNPEIPWSFRAFSSNPSLTEQDLLNHPEIDWDVVGLINHPYISHEFILEHYPENKHLRFLYGNGARKRSLNLDYVLDEIESTGTDSWSWMNLSRNPSISIDEILANPNLPWSKNAISRREDLTFEFIQQYPDLIDFTSLSGNPNLLLSFVVENPFYPWNTEDLWRNEFTLNNRLMLEDQILQRYQEMINTGNRPRLIEIQLSKQFGVSPEELREILNQ